MMREGLTLYRGPSQLNGRDIVAVVTGLGRPSRNPKTGPMAQVWILDASTPPHEAAKSGEDESVCGGCPMRPTINGTCYVTTHQAPLAVYNAYHRGNYPAATKDDQHALRRWPIRFGAYGDPCAVPLYIWERVLAQARGHSGYTHQWRDRRFQAYQYFLMASVESYSDYITARHLGWRPFRVRKPGDAVLPGEFECPASEEQGHRMTCMECGACNGNPKGKPFIASPTIIVHGRSANKLIDMEVG